MLKVEYKRNSEVKFFQCLHRCKVDLPLKANMHMKMYGLIINYNISVYQNSFEPQYKHIAFPALNLPYTIIPTEYTKPCDPLNTQCLDHNNTGNMTSSKRDQSIIKKHSFKLYIIFI